MIKKTHPSLGLIWVTVVLLIFVIISPLSEVNKILPNFIIVYMDDLAWTGTSVEMIDREPFSKNNLYQVSLFEKI